MKIGQPARIYLDSAPARPLDAYVQRIDPQATFTPENTYFRDDRVKQVVGVKLRLKCGIGFAKPGMPADGEILVEGNTWPSGRYQPMSARVDLSARRPARRLPLCRDRDPHA